MLVVLCHNPNITWTLHDNGAMHVHNLLHFFLIDFFCYWLEQAIQINIIVNVNMLKMSHDNNQL